jgi:hypothetical protein
MEKPKGECRSLTMIEKTQIILQVLPRGFPRRMMIPHLAGHMVNIEQPELFNEA